MVRLDPKMYFLLALLLLTLPLPWLLAAVTAALFHELCHLAAVKLAGGTVTGLTIGPGGAVMEGQLPPGVGEGFAILAGPVGSLALLSMCHVCPRIALCAGVQGLYNLLPLPWLDGGRALRWGMERLAQRRGWGAPFCGNISWEGMGLRKLHKKLFALFKNSSQNAGGFWYNRKRRDGDPLREADAVEISADDPTADL